MASADTGSIGWSVSAAGQRSAAAEALRTAQLDRTEKGRRSGVPSSGSLLAPDEQKPGQMQSTDPTGNIRGRLDRYLNQA